MNRGKKLILESVSDNTMEEDSLSVDVSSDALRFHKLDLEIGKEGITNTSTGVSLTLVPTEIEFGQVIGQGSSGVVFAARHIPSNTLIAIKSINIYERDKRKQLENDLKALDEFSSPFLVKYYGAFFADGVVKVAMELMDLGSTRRVIQLLAGRPEPVMPEAVLFRFTYSILQGLYYLHKEKHMVHRDIKPDNILINSKGDLKLCDFGVCRELANSAALCNTFVGTMTYMSPERLFRNAYGYPGDIWSVGLIVTELIRGFYPYPKPGNFIEMVENLQNLPPPQLPNNGLYSPQLVDFISRCLNTQPDQRATVQELLEHPWIQSNQGNNVNIIEWYQDIIRK
ncbi:hypothetical protein SteCoe_24641 [Stentor coeruleus]|uniref:mitogen-activated protein kinase kinase n=1 Tax=Stentor coeruleus TaxID=5963 RepID=A0A1R2BH41_9CILI|nr:hypothetical protein SteCoe_24641 [Stentor coeruleus]